MINSTEQFDAPKPVGPGGWWRRSIISFLLLVAGICVWQYLFPSDVSSSIEATAIDEGDANDAPETSGKAGSLLSQMTQETIDQAQHPFDSLLKIAMDSLAKTDAEIKDYTATLISQVRLNGKLQPEKVLFCKIRHPQTDGDNKCGLSVYTRFFETRGVKRAGSDLGRWLERGQFGRPHDGNAQPEKVLPSARFDAGDAWESVPNNRYWLSQLASQDG